MEYVARKTLYRVVAYAVDDDPGDPNRRYTVVIHDGAGAWIADEGASHMHGLTEMCVVADADDAEIDLAEQWDDAMGEIAAKPGNEDERINAGDVVEMGYEALHAMESWGWLAPVKEAR